MTSQETPGEREQSDAPGQLEIGDVIADRFEVLQELGRGGMSRVFKVRDKKLDAIRAMKVIRPDILNRKGVAELFRNEVRICQKLSHPNIVRVYDYDEDRVRGLQFFTMEFVDGVTLRSWLRHKHHKGSQATLSEFKAIAKGICAALDYAHKVTIHCDLKPANIIIDRTTRGVKVMDFGIARIRGKTKARLTGPHPTAGTRHYMAPEQKTRQEIDQRTDIYSTGVLLYEVLAGERPKSDSKPISEVRPDIPGHIGLAIAKALSGSPSDRFASAGDFLAALLAEPEAKSDESSADRPPDDPASAAPPAEITADSAEERLDESSLVQTDGGTPHQPSGTGSADDADEVPRQTKHLVSALAFTLGLLVMIAAHFLCEPCGETVIDAMISCVAFVAIWVVHNDSAGAATIAFVFLLGGWSLVRLLLLLVSAIRS